MVNHPDSFSTPLTLSIHDYSESKAKWGTDIALKWKPVVLPSDLFLSLFMNSMSSAFASCSLSSFCKVISGISSSGASLWMCLIYIWFQTPAELGWFFFFFLPFCSSMRFVGMQTGDEAGGLWEKKRLLSCFLLLFSPFPPVSDFCARSPPLSPKLAAAAASFASSLAPSVSLFAQRVAWELKTSAGAASSCSLPLFYHFLWRSHSYEHSYNLKYKSFSDASFLPFVRLLVFSVSASVCVCVWLVTHPLHKPVNVQTHKHATEISLKSSEISSLNI